MTPLSVGYVFDPAAQQAANAAGRNYWYAYTAEILSRLGVQADRLPPAACADPAALARVGVLIVGDDDLPAAAGAVVPALGDWLAAGGVLIGFGSPGLDPLFGVVGQGTAPQTGNEFAIGGYLELSPGPVTAGCRAPVAPEQRLIVVSPLRLVRCDGSRELARLFLPDPAAPGSGARATDSQRPAITHRPLGRGHAFYFAFGLPQTLWALHQGRPVDADYDGDGYLRVSDACVIGDNSRAVPYADALHFLLQNMIGRRPVPMLSPIPAHHGRIAPALLFLGGDDEGEPGNQVPASDYLASLGLPYHINAMPTADGSFAIGPVEQARIEANGHELALHYNFMDGFTHPGGFTREDVLAQAARFRARFGRDSLCSVAHWCRWVGWAEPARWMLEAGGRAENHRIHWTSPPLNPVNRVGFAFGSAFPRHYWDDARHGNARLDFLSLPIVAYEVGYEGDQVDLGTLDLALRLAVTWHLTLNLFWHPVYIARSPACRQAIAALADRLRAMPVPPVLMGPDELTRWWLARAASRTWGATTDAAGLRLQAECDWAAGFVVKVAVGQRTAVTARVDGSPAACECMPEFGQHWAYVALPGGRHSVEVRFG